MFSNRIANSARFLQMPTESQLFYFHLVLRADDDGIVEAYPVLKLLSIPSDNFKLLQAKGFIRKLNEDEVIVITDWTEHNTIRADRKVDSIYKHLLPNDIQIIEAKIRSDRPNQVPKERTHNIGRPTEINNGTLMGRHKLSKVKLSKVKRDTDPLCSSIRYLQEIPLGDIEEFKNITSATGAHIKEKGAALFDYCQAHGKKYRNYKAFLRNALRRDFPKKSPFSEEYKL